MEIHIYVSYSSMFVKVPFDPFVGANKGVTKYPLSEASASSFAVFTASSNLKP